jgi:hypothetical protein
VAGYSGESQGRVENRGEVIRGGDVVVAHLSETKGPKTLRPFTGVSAAGGNRPGVHAGFLAAMNLVLSGPFTGLLDAPREMPAIRAGVP